MAEKELPISGYTANGIVHHETLTRGRFFLEKPVTRDTLSRTRHELIMARGSS